MKKIINVLCYILSLFGTFVLIAWILGYPPTKNENPIVDNEGVLVIIQALSVIVLIGTVIYQVHNSIILAKRQEELIKKQNDIALFQKRYEVYKSLSEIAFPIYNSALNGLDDDSFFRDLFSRISVNEDDVILYRELESKIDELKRDTIKKANIKDREIRYLNVYIRRLKSKTFINNITVLYDSKFLLKKSLASEINDFLESIGSVVNKVEREYYDDFSYIYDFEYKREALLTAADYATTGLRESIEKEIRL